MRIHARVVTPLALALVWAVALGCSEQRMASGGAGGGAVGGEDPLGENGTGAPEEGDGMEIVNPLGDNEGEGSGGGENVDPASDDAVAGRTGQDGCEQVRTCVDNCALNDNTCITDCVAFGTEQAQDDYRALADCRVRNACIDDLCVANQCPQEEATCSGDSAGPGPGVSGGTCDAIFGCLQTCGEEDDVCAEACIEAATPESQQLFMSLVGCMQQNCAEAEDLQSCVEASCSPQLNACFAPAAGGGTDPGGQPAAGPSGDGTCPDIFACLQDCGEQDQACAQACVASADPVSQDAFMALVGCLQQSCMEAEDLEACAETSCPGQLNGCFGGGGAVAPGDGGADPNVPQPEGDGTCAGIFQCGNACPPDDRMCLQGCVSAAPVDAQESFTGVVDCLQEQCAEVANDQAALQACAEENCPDQLDACFGPEG